MTESNSLKDTQSSSQQSLAHISNMDAVVREDGDSQISISSAPVVVAAAAATVLDAQPKGEIDEETLLSTESKSEVTSGITDCENLNASDKSTSIGIVVAVPPSAQNLKKSSSDHLDSPDVPDMSAVTSASRAGKTMETSQSAYDGKQAKLCGTAGDKSEAVLPTFSSRTNSSVPPTELRSAVSLNAVIPPPPTSLEAGRNFSAPGAFRMYQMNASQDERDDSERNADDDTLQVAQYPAPAGSIPAGLAPPPLIAASSDGSYMVEAQLVREVSGRPEQHTYNQEMAFVEAKPLKETGVSRSRRIYLGISIVSIIAIALGVGVWLGKQKKSDNSVKSSASLEELVEGFTSSLPNYTLSALNNASSPQSQAFGWVNSDEGSRNVTTVNRLLARFGMATLYFATGGANWTDNKKWLSAAHECDWFTDPLYISCYDGENITGIHLNKNNLIGSFPAEVALIPNLDTIMASENQLTGMLPSEIAEVKTLQTLSLFKNELADMEKLLSLVESLPKLSYLDIEYNLFSGNIPVALANLTKLNNLFIGGNDLHGSIPSEYGNLVKLTGISLSELNLVGTIPPSLANLTKINMAFFYENQLEGTIPEILFDSWKATLNYFEFSNNLLTGTLSSKIGQLTRLTSLGVYSNPLTGSIPTEVGLMTMLTSLGLDACNFNGTIPTELALLTNLVGIYLEENALTGTSSETNGRIVRVDRTNWRHTILTFLSLLLV
jgi:Leucine-rich repeat (LRR) protein